MKYLITMLMAALMLLSPMAVYAQDTTDIPTEEIVIEEVPFDDSERSEDLEGDAGITPDSPLWGIEIALDRIRLAMTRGPAKAQLGLKIAEERLLEVKAMAEAGEVRGLERAEEAHAKQLEMVRISLDEVDEETTDDETITELEEGVDRHLAALARLMDEVEGNEDIPEDVKARIRTKLENADGSVEELRAKVGNKISKFQVKRKAEGFKQDLEVKVKGKLTPEQRNIVKELATSIEESDSTVKIALECKQPKNGKGKNTGVSCKSDIRGDLSEDQQILADRLLESLEESESRIKVEIKSKFKLKDDDDDEEDELEVEIEIEDEDKDESDDEDYLDEEESDDDEDDESEDDEELVTE